MSKTKDEIMKDVNFQVPLDVFKKELLKKANGEQQYQKLVDNVFPILMEGMEKLAKEVEVLIESKEEIDPEVRQRFNPCLFLGQYLMRNNPKYASS